MLPRIPLSWGVVLVLSALCLGQFGLSRYRAAQSRAQVAKIAQIEDALRSSESARKRLEHSTSLRARLRASAAQETASTGKALDSGISDSPEWAQQRVPEGIKTALGAQ